MAILTDPVIEEALLPQLDALMSAHYLEIACFTLLVYDYAITFGQEVQYFWRGAWTLSRILFLLNRYIPLCVMTSLTVVFFGTGFSVQSCTYATRAVFFLSIVAICINQAILLLRVWYMFPYSPLLRTIASSSFIACTLASLFLTGSNIHGLYSIQPPWGPDVPIPGCSAPPASGIWKSFVPTTVVHSVLYALTVVRAAKQPWGVPRARLLMRLVREGGLVYFVAMVSAIFSAVGARLTAVPSINYPAYSNLTLVVNAVSVSRLMLSARSLAGKLQTDPRWLLNPTELSRVNWRIVSGDGTQGHEIMVELDTYEPESSPILQDFEGRGSHLWGL